MTLEYRLRFVGRASEISALELLSNKGAPTPIYLYGPEGCGKSRLVREFVSYFSGLSVYVDAIEESNLSGAIMFSPILKEVLLKRSLRDVRIFIAVDDVSKVIGLGKIDLYIKWLYELLWRIRTEHKPKSILIVATTSEASSLRAIAKHSYADVRLIWNLNEVDFWKLASQLNPPSDSDVEMAWKYTGGNPRMLIDIAERYNWNIGMWMRAVRKRVEAMGVIERVKSRNLFFELRRVIEEPDEISFDLAELLIDENLLINKSALTLDDKEIEKNPDLGIGRKYAWQAPVYRYVIDQLLQIS